MSSLTRPSRRRGSAWGLAGAGLMVLAAGASGCSIPRRAEPVVPSEPTVVRTYAMTGLPAPDGWRPRPVLVTKIDNTEAGQPQQGVGMADMVIEEPVEGGLTRLAAFYESKLPESVGPVRSVRTSDIGLVQPVSATVVASGGAPQTLSAFKLSDIPLITEGNAAFVRDPERSAPYNLYVDLTRVKRADEGGVPKQPYFTFGKPDLPPGAAAAAVTVTFSPAVRDHWSWDRKNGVWRRTDVGDGSIVTPTLIVATVRTKDAGYLDPAGNRVPEIIATGRGRGYMLVNGQVHPIAWLKRSDTDPWQFTTEAGLVIPVPAGEVWLALIPKGEGSVDFS